MPDSISVLAGGAASVFLGSLVQGTAGLGFALVAVPMLILFLPHQTAIPSLLVLGSVVNILVLIDVRKHIAFRPILPFIIIGIAAVPLGSWVLMQLNGNAFRIFVGIVIGLVAVLMISGFRLRIKNEKIAALPIGLLSGILQGSLTMCGPPMIFYLMNQNLEQMKFKAYLVSFIMVMNISAFASFYYEGLMSPEVLRYAFWFLPVALSGGAAGIYLSRKLNEELFRRTALLIVAAGGVMSVLSGLGII